MRSKHVQIKLKNNLYLLREAKSQIKDDLFLGLRNLLYWELDFYLEFIIGEWAREYEA